MLQRGLVEPGDVTSQHVLRSRVALQYAKRMHCKYEKLRKLEATSFRTLSTQLMKNDCINLKLAKQYNTFCKFKMNNVFSCGSQVLHYIKLIINITQVVCCVSLMSKLKWLYSYTIQGYIHRNKSYSLKWKKLQHFCTTNN